MALDLGFANGQFTANSATSAIAHNVGTTPICGIGWSNAFASYTATWATANSRLNIGFFDATAGGVSSNEGKTSGSPYHCVLTSSTQSSVLLSATNQSILRSETVSSLGATNINIAHSTPYPSADAYQTIALAGTEVANHARGVNTNVLNGTRTVTLGWRPKFVIIASGGTASLDTVVGGAGVVGTRGFQSIGVVIDEDLGGGVYKQHAWTQQNKLEAFEDCRVTAILSTDAVFQIGSEKWTAAITATGFTVTSANAGADGQQFVYLAVGGTLRAALATWVAASGNVTAAAGFQPRGLWGMATTATALNSVISTSVGHCMFGTDGTRQGCVGSWTAGGAQWNLASNASNDALIRVPATSSTSGQVATATLTATGATINYSTATQPGYAWGLFLGDEPEAPPPASGTASALLALL